VNGTVFKAVVSKLSYQNNTTTAFILPISLIQKVVSPLNFYPTYKIVASENGHKGSELLNARHD